MKVLHILKQRPDASTKKIIELHAAEHQVKIIELFKGPGAYDELIRDVFSHDKVFCW